MRKSFARNAVLLGISTISVRLMGFLFRLLLAHQLTARELGVYQLVLPVVGIIGAICASGLPDAVARLTARMGGAPSKRLLRISLLLALATSLPLSALLLFGNGLMATHLFGEASAAPILLALTPLPPLLAVSAVYQGVCLGREDAFHPGLANFCDQALRMAATIGIWAAMGDRYPGLFAASAYFCMSLGQSIGMAVLRRGGRRGIAKDGGVDIRLRNLTAQAAPMTASQLLSSGMRAINELLMPLFIMGTGLTRSEALAQYGMVTGMAIPIAFIPMSLLAPLSTLLSPGIAAQKARSEDQEAQNRAWHSLHFSLIVTSLAAAVVFAWAPQIAHFLYHRDDVAYYIRLVCPIIPMSGLMGLLSSTLLGLGEARKMFLIRVSMDATYVALAALFIPRIGWLGYTVVHLLQGTLTLFLMLRVMRKSGLRVKLPQGLLKAYFCAAVGAVAGLLCNQFVPLATPLACCIAHGIAAWGLGLYPPLRKLKALRPGTRLAGVLRPAKGRNPAR